VLWIGGDFDVGVSILQRYLVVNGHGSARKPDVRKSGSRSF
jgi:hypothetical protein